MNTLNPVPCVNNASGVKEPRAAFLAAIIWIAFGGMMVMGAVTLTLTLILECQMHSVKSLYLVLMGVAATVGILLSSLFGAAFVRSGVRTLRGAAADVLATSIVSLMIGGVFALYAVVSIDQSPAGGRGFTALLQNMGGVLVVGGALAAAGFLGLGGRADYRMWRHASQGNPFRIA